LGPLKALSAPLIAAALVTAGAGLHTATSDDIPMRTEQVELMATIDTASSAVGISESSLYFMSQSDLDTAMQQMQTMGVTQVRVLLPWQYMEPADGTFNWTQADQLLNTAAKYGIAIDADITSSPSWATKYSPVPAGAPTSVSDYVSFVQAVAERYGSSNNSAGGLLSSIEVWNEPNGFTGWYPTPSAQNYTDLLKAAYTAIKDVAPGITVVGGVLGAAATIGSISVNPVTFLQQMYAAGAAGYFDALSFHPYTYGADFSAGIGMANSAIQQLQALRALMNANGDAAKLIWATEYGQSSAGTNGQATQAAYIQDFLDTWSTLTGVGPMFIYSLLDDAEGNNMGLFTSDWTAKAAAAIVAAWIAAHPEGSPATSIPGTIGSVVSGVVQTVVNAVTSVVSNLVGAVSGLVNTVSNAISNLLKALTGTAKKAAAAVAATTKTTTSATALAATESTDSSADVADASVAVAGAEQTAALAVSAEKSSVSDSKSTTDDTSATADKTTTAATTASSDDKSGSTDATATGTTDTSVTDTSVTDTSVADTTAATDDTTSTTTGTAAATTGVEAATKTGTGTATATATTPAATSSDSSDSSGTSTAATSGTSSSSTSGSATAASSTTSTSNSGSDSSTGSTSNSDSKTTKKSKKDKKKKVGSKAGSKPSTKSGRTGPKSAGASSSSTNNSSSNSHKSSHSSSKGKHHASA
jgi:hypothetical protein